VAQLERPVGWVLVVAMNQMKRWIERADREFDPLPTDAADHADAVSSSASIRDALDALPPRQRAVVVFRYLCDLPNADVAKALGCATGTIKSTLHAALKQLRVELEDDVDEEVSHAG
jgi:RNA polymerase sigma factor (sigma-70 family)